MSKKTPSNLSWSWVPGLEDAEVRLDLAVFQAMQKGEGHWSAPAPAISRSQVQRWLTEQGFKVGARLVAGKKIVVEVPAATPLELVPEDRAIEILFEDEHLLIVNKPQGLTVHPSETQKTGTLVHALLFHVRDLSGIGGKLRPGIVHRIDKDTSGALVITKTDIAHQRLVEVFAKHDIERVYWALCYGAPSTMEWRRIETLIGRHPVDRKRMSTQVKAGRKAITHYGPLERYGDYASWLEVKLETGRTHQVRVHLTGEGLPLFGDPVYGTPSTSQARWKNLPSAVKAAVPSLPGQALHARVLGFTHPVTGAPIRVEAEPPAEFKKVLAALRK